MKKKYSIIIFLLIASLFSSCGITIKNTGNKKNDIPPISSEEVIKLTANAAEKYIYIINDGGLEEYKPFQYNGNSYVYYGKALDTRDELMSYLMEAYTKKGAERIIEEFNIVVVDGKMAKPDAGIGDASNWEMSTAELVKDSGNKREYKLKVPYAEGEHYQHVDVYLEYVDKTGWRVVEYLMRGEYN